MIISIMFLTNLIQKQILNFMESYLLIYASKTDYATT